MEEWLKVVKATAENKLGRPIVGVEWEIAIIKATTKLNSIIAREGDADGLRNSAEYLGRLIAEQIQAAIFCPTSYKAFYSA